ncbi:nucleotidyltransferase domain-containing protein [Streptomyces beijiangensis]|uniref:Nucleotidyltransferase domain-containing protein n=1 Tax=Streptomyces beijiangensis TaxID=163361 RepID=A0A939JBX2_9ACTN|nr:nucleotidyltransferase domain-containing protein [Streptomyces beijiangensis]MBO0510406.1 nucleotidyltransferase domain-containing protein [Streptomyces beijiangensis]
MNPGEAARAVVEERHPAARAAFLGGSVLTARRTDRSDLDIVVLLPDGDPDVYRESFWYGPWPVELFSHTEARWRGFVDREIPLRRSPLLFMCAEGELLFDRDGGGALLAAEAARLVAAGPPAVTVEELEVERYRLTDLLDDLAGCTDPGERLCIVGDIARNTGRLLLLSQGAWLGGGKWLARRTDAVRPGFSGDMHRTVREALDGRTDALVALVDEVLALVGGRFWEGFRRG